MGVGGGSIAAAVVFEELYGVIQRKARAGQSGLQQLEGLTES